MSTIEMTSRAGAPAVAAAEYAAMLASLRELPTDAWAAPTDCTGWQVRDVVAHVAGAAEEAARVSVMARHYVRAAVLERGRLLVDAVNDQQVAERRRRSPEQLLDELERLAPKAVRGRAKLPGLIRQIPLPASAGGLPGDDVGYLNDVTYTRDIWMHRVDIARATGTPLGESAGEAHVVAQIVRDLSRAWVGPSFTLELTGRGGGTWRVGNSAPGQAVGGHVTGDSVALSRVLAGRSDETAMTHEPAGGRGAELIERLRATRLLF